MDESTKKLLIVDDSEIDRGMLSNTLSGNFEIIEAENGYSALEIILSRKIKLSAVILDITMPVLDGFAVLRLMRDNKADNVPVILITAEATKNNVQRAAEFNVAGFIRKPFEPDVVLDKLSAMFDIEVKPAKAPQAPLTKDDISETNTYISKLEIIYKGYLKNIDSDDEHFSRVSRMVEIILNRYREQTDSTELDPEHISLIAKAAYFYDIGRMAIPSDILNKGEANNMTDSEALVYTTHAALGANMIWLNTSASCRYFVHVCADMCMHHHERFDGKGYPHGLSGTENSVFTQICSLCAYFDKAFMARDSQNSRQFDLVADKISLEAGRFNNDLCALLTFCKDEILGIYIKTSKTPLIRNF